MSQNAPRFDKKKFQIDMIKKKVETLQKQAEQREEV